MVAWVFVAQPTIDKKILLINQSKKFAPAHLLEYFRKVGHMWGIMQALFTPLLGYRNVAPNQQNVRPAVFFSVTWNHLQVFASHNL